MIESVDHLLRHGYQHPVCIAVHGIFADGADQALVRRGARVITCNTIPHPTNEIDVSALIATGAAELRGDTVSFAGTESINDRA